jgi:Helix-turn-helix domain
MSGDQNPLGDLGKCIELVPQLLAKMDRIEKLLESFEKPRPDRKFLTLKQTAEELNLCVKSVRRLIDRGLLKTSKGTRAVRVPVEEIEAYKRRTV